MAIMLIVIATVAIASPVSDNEKGKQVLISINGIPEPIYFDNYAACESALKQMEPPSDCGTCIPGNGKICPLTCVNPINTNRFCTPTSIPVKDMLFID